MFWVRICFVKEISQKLNNFIILFKKGGFPASFLIKFDRQQYLISHKEYERDKVSKTNFVINSIISEKTHFLRTTLYVDYFIYPAIYCNKIISYLKKFEHKTCQYNKHIYILFSLFRSLSTLLPHGNTLLVQHFYMSHVPTICMTVCSHDWTLIKVIQRNFITRFIMFKYVCVCVNVCVCVMITRNVIFYPMSRKIRRM